MFHFHDFWVFLISLISGELEVLLKAKNNNKSEKIALYHINLAIIIRNEK